MDKTEALNDRRDLQYDIKRRIQEFEDKHGLAVTGIELHRNYGSNYADSDVGNISESHLNFVIATIEL